MNVTTALMTEHIIDAIDMTEARVARHRDSTIPAFEVPGMTGLRVRLFLNSICRRPHVRHLEIGCNRGATICAAAHGNDGRFLTIDSYANPGDGDRRLDARENIKRHADHVELRVEDCWHEMARLKEQGEVFDSYFFDGPHEESDHFYAMIAADGITTNPFIAIVDDWVRPAAQIGTKRAFDMLNWRPVVSHVLASDKPSDANGWWCDLGVFLIEKPERPPSQP